mgnify:CR=1 FL=1
MPSLPGFVTGGASAIAAADITDAGTTGVELVQAETAADAHSIAALEDPGTREAIQRWNETHGGHGGGGQGRTVGGGHRQ